MNNCGELHSEDPLPSRLLQPSGESFGVKLLRIKFGYYYYLIAIFSLHVFQSMSMPEMTAASKVPLSFLPKSAPKGGKGMLRFVEVFEVEEETNSTQTEVRANDIEEDFILTNTTYYNKKWVSGKNETSRPPQQINPPDGYSFASEWKIDVSNQTSLDSQGWIEYIEVPQITGESGKRKRRRRWVRSIQPVSSSDATSLQALQKSSPDFANSTEISAISSNASIPSHRRKKKKKTRLTRLVQAIENEFRFKGFGWTIVKSVLLKESCGAGLKIPLSSNFDVIERCPYIPIISSSCYLYYPWTAAAALSVSLPCEVLRHFMVLAIQFIQRWIYLLTLMGTSVNAQAVVPPIDVAKLRFSKNVQERVELSFSWRLSKRKGYEFRVTSSYIYLPTLVYLHQTLATAVQTFFPRFLSRVTDTSDDELQTIDEDKYNDDIDDVYTSKASDSMSNEENKFQEWLRQRTASLGLQVGCPIPDYSGFSCNLVCNLSGYYYSLKHIAYILSRKNRK